MNSDNNGQNYAIHTTDLVKDYQSGFWMRRFRALHELNLQVYKGESFGFVGPNGAGKTTTIKILAGLQDATSGAACILGNPYSDPKTRSKLGFLPERPYFYVHLTARELLDFYGRLYHIPTQLRKQRIEELLSRSQMSRFGDIQLKKYSKGMLQRIGLCQALLNDPELIILDEPMSGLDPLGRALVRDIIVEEQSKGKTIFFSSHVLSDVQAICSRVGIIVGGQLRGVGTIDELINKQVQHIDCCFSLPTPLDLPGELRRQDGNLYWIRLAPEDIDQVIDQVRQTGGEVRELIPLRLSLEQVLVDEIQRSQPLDQKKMGVWV